MKSITNRTLGFAVTVSVPETAEEYDGLAGRVGACVDDANNNVLYRSWNHKFRKALCEAVEEETGEERGNTVNEETGKKTFTEQEKVYVSRVISEGLIEQEEVDSIAQRVAPGIEFDPKPTSRKKKVPEEISKAVTTVLAALEEGTTTEAKVASNLAAQLGIEDFSASYGDVNEESLTRALIAREEKRQREVANDLI